jgi:hypothetical protein
VGIGAAIHLHYKNMGYKMENIVRLHPDDMSILAELVARKISGIKEEDEKLLNLKDLAVVLDVPYSTLSKKSLPFHRTGRRDRKLYRKSEVFEYLKR